jgi:hypothetical protein
MGRLTDLVNLFLVDLFPRSETCLVQPVPLGVASLEKIEFK